MSRRSEPAGAECLDELPDESHANQGCAAFTQGGNSRYESFVRLTQIQKPTSILVMLDERGDSINDGLFAIDMSNTGRLDGQGASQPYCCLLYTSPSPRD